MPCDSCNSILNRSYFALRQLIVSADRIGLIELFAISLHSPLLLTLSIAHDAALYQQSAALVHEKCGYEMSSLQQNHLLTLPRRRMQEMRPYSRLLRRP